MSDKETALHNPTCFNNHMGLYLVQDEWLIHAVNYIKGGIYKPRDNKSSVIDLHNPVCVGTISTDKTIENNNNKNLYQIANGGIAVIPVMGLMMKGMSKYDDTCSTVIIRQAIRAAANDTKVNSILLVIDSPGGTVAGTEELANDISYINKNIKKVYAQVEDMCCSGALWIASQCDKVYSNATALIGSIGTMLVVVDTSEAMKMEGIKVHVLSTGEFKGTGVGGVPVTEPQLAYLQERINQINTFFIAGVVDGRQIEKKQVLSVADGRVFLAKEAKQFGLIDGIQSSDTTIAMMSTKFKSKVNPINTRVQEAVLTMKTLE